MTCPQLSSVPSNCLPTIQSCTGQSDSRQMPSCCRRTWTGRSPGPTSGASRSKCSTLHFGRSNAKRVYFMRGTELKQVATERDLGVLIDSELKFREQAASAVSKATQILAVIRRSFQLIDQTMLPLLFKTGASTS